MWSDPLHPLLASVWLSDLLRPCADRPPDKQPAFEPVRNGAIPRCGSTDFSSEGSWGCLASRWSGLAFMVAVPTEFPHVHTINVAELFQSFELFTNNGSSWATAAPKSAWRSGSRGAWAAWDDRYNDGDFRIHLFIYRDIEQEFHRTDGRNFIFFLLHISYRNLCCPRRYKQCPFKHTSYPLEHVADQSFRQRQRHRPGHSVSQSRVNDSLCPAQA